ncbi:MAG: hypothetical protein ACK5PQ_02415 [Alphaproteobacteria bacterium]
MRNTRFFLSMNGGYETRRIVDSRLRGQGKGEAGMRLGLGIRWIALWHPWFFVPSGTQDPSLSPPRKLG